MKKFLESILSNGEIKVGGKNTEKVVDNAEKELGVKFSEPYREYLLELGTITYDGHEITGLGKTSWTNVVDVTLEQREIHPHIPADWYVIEEAHIDDIIIWQSGSGEIYQSSYSFPPVKISSSFEAYLAETGIDLKREIPVESPAELKFKDDQNAEKHS